MLKSNRTIQLLCSVHSLWEQHIFWTTATITAMVFNLPNRNQVTNRLLRNADDFEQLFRPFYGPQVSARFGELLRDHLIIAAELVQAAIDGDNKAATNAERRWYDNAAEISAFLGSINPFWSAAEWNSMFRQHLELTKEEAVTLIQGDYTRSIALTDEIERQALMMANVMAEGIIRQFSKREDNN